MDDHRSPIFVPPVLLPPSPEDREPDRAPSDRPSPDRPARDAAGRDAAARSGEPVFVAPVAADAGDAEPPRPRIGWVVAPVPRAGSPAPAQALVVAPGPETRVREMLAPETLPPTALAPRPLVSGEVVPVAAVEVAAVAEPVLLIPRADRGAGAPARIAEPVEVPVYEEVPPRVEEEIAPEARVTRDVEVAPPPVRRRHRWLIWLLLIVLVIGAGVWLVTRSASKATHKGRLQSGAAMPVGTATVTTGDIPVTLSALGTVTPLATVTVQTQINGQLLSVGFKEGQIVHKGDFLAQIDPRPYQVALEQAQGTLAKDQASLRDAQIDLVRYRKLVAQNSIAAQTLTTQIYLVQQDQGTVLADQAAVDTQKLNLVYCHIVAPVSGLVGLRQIDPGNYVQTSSTTGIVVITQLQPISVLFTLPQQDLQEVLARTKAGVKLPVTAYDSSGTIKLDTGVFSTFDNQINTTTGTIEARSIFPNAKFVLYPNQFVNVDLLVDTLHNADIVPTSAIERGAPGTYVYVVQPNNTVAVQAVKLGPADGQRQAILSGLKPGQVVVTDGADRLKAGAKITEAPPTPTTAAATPAAATPAATPAGATPPSSTAPGATGPGATAVGPNSPPATTPPATTPVGAPPPAAAPAAAVLPATALPATALPARTPAATTPAGAAPPAATPVPAATPNAPGTALQSVTPPPERTHHRRRKPASSDDGSSE